MSFLLDGVLVALHIITERETEYVLISIQEGTNRRVEEIDIEDFVHLSHSLWIGSADGCFFRKGTLILILFPSVLLDTGMIYL